MNAELSFGQWLKRRRLGLGMTQDELGRRIGYSEVSIRKVEADERRPSVEMAEKLALALSVAPEDRPAFMQFARDEASTLPLPTSTTGLPSRGDRTAPPVAPNRLTNLFVPPTPLIGREAAVAAIKRLLHRPEVRLVTLTGTGGTGKTRLALQIAIDAVDAPLPDVSGQAFPDGVFFVDLTPVTDPHQVVTAIAHALNLREQSTRPLIDMMKDYLREKHLLLLLDNFEQVVAAAPVVADLLATAPLLKVLVTSRLPLRVRGEHIHAVEPLALPDLNNLPALEQLTQYEAVRLFLERAAAGKTDFRLTDENALAVVQICHRLDGLPLALELAAARVGMFPPQTLLGRLSHRLKVLTGGARDLPARHRTLRGAMEWSYHLLDEPEQTLFCWLAVFVGGFTLRAAEAIGGVEGGLDVDGVEGVASLVDKNLVKQREGADGEPRFTMLETIREYGLEKLVERGGEESARRHHAHFFLELAERAEPNPWPQMPWLDGLEREHDNLRAALAWAKVNEPATGLRLAGALGWFWYYRSHYTEGRQWLEQMLASPDRSARARAKALYRASEIARMQADYGRAHALGSESLALFRALGDEQGSAYALRGLGYAVFLQGDSDRAMGPIEASLALFRKLGDGYGITWDLVIQGVIAKAHGEYQEATTLIEEALGLCRAGGDYWGTYSILAQLADIAYEQGQYERAAPLFDEVVRLARSLWPGSGDDWVLSRLGRLALAQADYARANVMLTEALAYCRSHGLKREVAQHLGMLGWAAHGQGDVARATRLFKESLIMQRDQGGSRFVADCLIGLARVALTEGQPGRAARLLGAAEAWREARGLVMPPIQRSAYERDVAALRASLDEHACSAVWAAGRAMTTEQAIAYALEDRSLTAPAANEYGAS